jgi:SAM-dependent methyltransferase
MLGLGGTFLYSECAACGCVALQNPPADLAPFYPAEKYYSFACRNRNRIMTQIADRFRVSEFPVISTMVRKYRPDPTMASLAPLSKSLTILDVGAGSGQIVKRLQQVGYDAIGIDPFVTADIHNGTRLLVKKCTLADLRNRFDVILLSHSLEHVPDQVGTLRHVAQHLHEGGRAIIRIPLALEAWRRDRIQWRELDPPRHFVLHTPISFEMACRASGLMIRKVTFDSDDVCANERQQGERASFVLVRASEFSVINDPHTYGEERPA